MAMRGLDERALARCSATVPVSIQLQTTVSFLPALLGSILFINIWM